MDDWKYRKRCEKDCQRITVALKKKKGGRLPAKVAKMKAMDCLGEEEFAWRSLECGHEESCPVSYLARLEMFEQVQLGISEQINVNLGRKAQKAAQRAYYGAVR